MAVRTRNPADPSRLEEPSFSVSLMICGINTSSCASFLITKQEFTLGKAETCDGVLDFSEEVSREHARIHWADGQYTITDLDSKNGTYLNGCRIPPGQAYLLRPGDRIGLSTLLFSAEYLKR